MNVDADFPPPAPSRRGLGCLGWSLILAGVCAALCAGGVFLGYRWVSNAFTMDAAKVREITAKIADFTPPENLHPAFGFDMNFGVTTIQAGFFAAEGLPMVMLMQFTGMSEEDAHRQLEDVGGQLKNFVPLATTEKQVVVRGQDVTATVQTGEWRDEPAGGPPQRLPTVKAAASFEGRGGAANVIVLVPGNDDAAVDEAISLVETVR